MIELLHRHLFTLAWLLLVAIAALIIGIGGVK